MGSGTGFLHAARRGLTRDAKLLLVSFSLTGLSIGLLNVSLSVYMQRLGLTAVHAGTFFTSTGLTSVSLVIPFGILADRYGRRRMTILGTALMAAALGMLVLADSYGMFLLAGGLLGVAEALGFSTFNALLAEATDPAVRTSVFGMSFFFNSMGFAAGNLLGILPDVLYAANPADPTGAYRPAFAIAAGLSLASPLALLLVRVGRTRAPEGRSLLPRKSARILTRFFASNFIIGLGAGLIIPLFTLWFYLKFGLAESTTGPLLALASVFMAFSYLLAPVLSRRRGMVRSIVEVQALATATLFFIPLVLNIHVVGALYIARNLLMNMTWPVASAFLMSAVDESERAAASAVTGAAFRLPFAISTTAGGYLLTVNVDLPFFVTTALYAVGVLTFWAFFHGYKDPTPG